MSQQMRPDAGLLDRLVFAAQGGERDAAAQLIQIASGWIKSVARRLCRRFGLPEHEVDDIAQEALARVLDPQHQRYFLYRRKAVPKSGAFAPSHAYLVGHVLSAINFGTRRRRGQLDAGLVDIFGGEACDGAAQLEAQITVFDLVHDLPSKMQEAVIRVYVNEETEREAAAALELSAPTVCRMLRKFREQAAVRLAA